MSKRELLKTIDDYKNAVDSKNDKIKELEYQLHLQRSSLANGYDKLILEKDGKIEVYVDGVRIPRINKLRYEVEGYGYRPIISMEVM